MLGCDVRSHAAIDPACILSNGFIYVSSHDIAGARANGLLWLCALHGAACAATHSPSQKHVLACLALHCQSPAAGLCPIALQRTLSECSRAQRAPTCERHCVSVLVLHLPQDKVRCT